MLSPSFTPSHTPSNMVEEHDLCVLVSSRLVAFDLNSLGTVTRVGHLVDSWPRPGRSIEEDDFCSLGTVTWWPSNGGSLAGSTLMTFLSLLFLKSSPWSVRVGVDSEVWRVVQGWVGC